MARNSIYNPKFHERYRGLFLLGLIGGLYQPAIEKNYPESWKQKIMKMYSTIACIFLVAVPSLGLIDLIFIKRSMYEVIVNLMVIISGLHGVSRSLWFIFKRKAFNELFNTWDEYFGSDGDFQEREANIEIHYCYLKRKMFFLITMAFGSLNQWSLSQYFQEKKDLKLPTPLPYKHQSPDFEILVTAYAFPIVALGFETACIQILMLLPTIWVLGELERLRKSLKCIICLAQLSSESSAPGIQAAIDRALQKWVNQHRKTTMYFHKAKKLLVVPYTIEMLTTFTATWLTAYDMVQPWATNADKLSSLFVYSTYVLMFALTCYFSDLVKVQGQCVLDDAFAENWAILSKKTRNSLLIIAQNTQRPLTIKGFAIYPTGFITLFKIIQSAYSVLQFLIVATEKSHHI